MLLEIPLPKKSLRPRYALLVGDEKVDFVRWKSGVLDILGSYSNDQPGLADFKDFLGGKEGKKYAGKAVSVLLNIVGEDYRYELTPHLVGRYKSSFLKKRLQTMYRGATFTQAVTLGREELGKRQDMTLFIGVLTEDKVAPWIRLLSRNEMLVSGLFSQALALRKLVRSLDLAKKHAVITLFTGANSIRQCYFHNGQLRHSRVTKLPQSDSPAVLMKALSAESDRFQQYLTQLKIARGVRVEFRVIVPPKDLDDFQKNFKSVAKEKADHYFFYDGEQVAKLLGVKKPMNEWGSDNSIGIHCALTSIPFESLASLDTVRFYWLRLVTYSSAALVGAYALYLIGIQVTLIAQTYLSYQLDNQRLSVSVKQLRDTYDGQVAEFVTPPSTPENMRAVTNTFSHSGYDQINPGPLLYYVSGAIQKNPALIELKELEWYLTDEAVSGKSKPLAYVTGSSLYQVLVLKGTFADRRNQTLEDALASVDRFLSGFDERPDVEVILVRGPKPLTAEESVSGKVSLESSAVSAAELTNLNFEIRVVWHQRDGEFYDQLLGEEADDA